ncbi:MAG: ferredoxin [Lachnospiraceae bacterium]|nr:ferredoxin [Lachnospiraceae bacterium]
MKYFVNENCIGCGLCVETCPEVFVMTDEEVAKAQQCELEEEVDERAREAMEDCPVDAIENA